MSSALLPFVLAGIHRVASLGDAEKARITEQLSQWTVRRIQLPGVGARKINYEPDSEEVFEVTSTTDQVASHVLCTLFDHRTRAFRVSPYQLEVIAPRESGYFYIAKSTLNADELCELISKLYESRGEYLKAYVRGVFDRGDSVLIPIFFDLAGRLYATPRPIHWEEDGSASYGKSDLLQPAEFSDDFAPTFESTKARMA